MDDILFDGRSSLYDYGLELLNCYVTAPRQKHNYLQVPCGDGQIDAMEGLCAPVYEPRLLTAAFRAQHPGEASARMLRNLSGKVLQIVTPDDIDHFWMGTLDLRSAGRRSGDMITLEAVVFPWRYARQQACFQYPASLQTVSAVWDNTGGRDVIPQIQIDRSSATIHMGDVRKTLTPGTYELSEYLIPAGSTLEGAISGGEVTVTYRTAIL